MKIEKINNETIKENTSVTNEQMKIEIAKILSEAQSHAIESDLMNEMFSEKIRMLSLPPDQFLKNLEKYKEIDNKIKEHTILVKTLIEYKILLEMTGADDALIHENAHANKAESLGAIFNGYTLLVSKTKNGYMYAPAVSYEIPFFWDEKKKIEADIKIANAPEEYENRLSDGDKERIKLLQEQLKKLI